MNASAPFLSIVVPAFNEEKRLPRSLKQIIAFLREQPYPSELIVVTDGSTDNTALVARSFCADFPGLTVMEFKQNRGKGFGVKEGLLAAKGKFRLFMDADYAVPVDFATPFLAKMQAEQLDILIGSRTAAGSQFEQRQPFIRQQLGIAFGVVQRLLLAIPFKDTQCGFKMFTAQATERYFPQVKYECAYFDAELLYIAHNAGAKIGEHPVRWKHDNETRLPIGANRTAKLLKKLWLIKSLHPIATLASQTKSVS
jgi:glycosyltransferase involved in cell wall biosynthesis